MNEIKFRLALRQTEGLIGSIISLLGLTLAIPDHSTLSRRAEMLDVPRLRSSSGAAFPIGNRVVSEPHRQARTLTQTASHAAQLVTLRFCFGMWWRRAALALNGTGRLGSEQGPASYPNRTQLTNLRSVQQGHTAAR